MDLAVVMREVAFSPRGSAALGYHCRASFGPPVLLLHARAATATSSWTISATLTVLVFGVLGSQSATTT